MKRPVISLLIAVFVLSACGFGRDNDDVRLTRLTNTGNGPEEFDITPGKPLQEPESYSALPTPTPGGTNRTDATPLGDGVAALGGNPAAIQPAGVGANDGALLNHTRRFGVTPGVRQTLAAEDVEVRRRQGRVNILGIGANQDYANAYRRQWLDSRAEAERLRKVGIPTPAAPPSDRRRSRR